MQPAYDLPIDVGWPEELESKDWRELPDLDDDEYENDEDSPTPQHVIDILGFDPDELDEG